MLMLSIRALCPVLTSISSFLACLFVCLFVCRSLQCSTCNKLRSAIYATQLPEIAAKCKECCVQDQKYDAAVLEADKKYLKSFYPEIHQVLSDKSLTGLVKLRPIEGARPSLLLYNRKDESPDTVSTKIDSSKSDCYEDHILSGTVNVGNWKRDAIKEYLQVNIK